MSKLGDAEALAAGVPVGGTADASCTDEALAAGEAERAGGLGVSWQAPLRSATPAMALNVVTLCLTDNLARSAADQARVVVDERAGGAR